MYVFFEKMVLSMVMFCGLYSTTCTQFVWMCHAWGLAVTPFYCLLTSLWRQDIAWAMPHLVIP